VTVSPADPSQPLTNKRHEQYAMQRAKGVDQATSWQRTIPFGQAYSGGNTSLRVSGHRVEKRPEVRSRIDWLFQQARNAVDESPEALSRGDIVAASLEVSEALEAAYRACADEITVPPQALERLKSVWSGHLARQGKLEEAGPTPETDPSPHLAALTRYMERVCTCQKL